jgi:glutamyl/glutaminyl-tRNA synthetase
VTREVIAWLGVPGGYVIHPVRVAVSGRTTGPSLFEMLEVLGKPRVLQRLRQAQRWSHSV